MGKILAIVGRPNVGKSTLFNRLVGKRQAIVDDLSGVTRDRHYGVAEWLNKEFIVVDTGGYVTGSNDFFEGEIRKQVEIAVGEADLLLFMVDVDAGLTDEDKAFAKLIRKTKKPIIVVVNKVDNSMRMPYIGEFYALGMDDVMGIASASGFGTGELLDRVVELMQPEEIFSVIKKGKDVTKKIADVENIDAILDGEFNFEEDDFEDFNIEESEEEEEEAETVEIPIPKIAVIGRPNVGKSTFINTLLGEDRSIVSDIAGTTRDAIHTLYNKFGKEIQLIDTAGIRKKAKVSEDIEFYSVMRAISAMEEADVIMLMIDAKQGLEAQDVNIFQLAQARRKGIVILVNKWDLIEKDTQTHITFTENIHKKIAPFVDVPILYISATEKTRILKSIEVAEQVFHNRRRRVSTSKLNELMLPIIAATPPPTHKGKYVRIKYCTQLPVKTPAFAFFCNLDQYFKESYRRFLENQLRQNFDYSGVPIQIFFRKK